MTQRRFGKPAPRGPRPPRQTENARADNVPRGPRPPRQTDNARADYAPSGPRPPRQTNNTRADNTPRGPRPPRQTDNTRADNAPRGPRPPRQTDNTRADNTPRGPRPPRQTDNARADNAPRGPRPPRQTDNARADNAPGGPRPPRQTDNARADYAPRGPRPPRQTDNARADNAPSGPRPPRQTDNTRADNAPRGPRPPRQTENARADNAPRGPRPPRQTDNTRADNAPRGPRPPRQTDNTRADNAPRGPRPPRQTDNTRADNAPRGPRPPRQTDNTRADNARWVALNILQDVSHEDAYASLALGKRLRDSKLPQRDRDLVAELVYGTLEWQISLDYIIDKKLERPDVESVIRDILRLGAYQILYLTRIPDSAAVDESVKLAHGMGRTPFAGLVNGVLRGIVRDKEAGEGTPWPAREGDAAQYLSVRYSLPKWIVERLIDAYGESEAEAIAAYRPEERHFTLRRTPDKLSAAEFEALMTSKGWQWRPGRLPDTYFATGIGDVGIDKEYLQGFYSVQSESSMIAAMAVSPKRGGTVLDACAAPGGKTAQLAAMMHGTGRVYAWDIHEGRVELIRNMVKRLRLDTVRPAVRDATIIKEDLIGTMDAVLLDAPCSGLGVMLSKPDVKYRQTPEAVESLAQVQKRLLDACCRYVRPGGTLVYSTCTILPEENAGQIRAFLAAHSEFEPDGEGLVSSLPDIFKDRADGCMLQLMAHRDGTEGFFIARMRRRRV